MSNLDTLLDIMEKHQDFNFVKRIMYPEVYTKLFDNEGGLMGEPSTHSMAWGTDDKGEAFAYPTVVQTPEGPLKRLGEKEAWQHAKDTGERISFGQDKAQADWFSKEYKTLWKQP